KTFLGFVFSYIQLGAGILFTFFSLIFIQISKIDFYQVIGFATFVGGIILFEYARLSIKSIKKETKKEYTQRLMKTLKLMLIRISSIFSFLLGISFLVLVVLILFSSVFYEY